MHTYSCHRYTLRSVRIHSINYYIPVANACTYTLPASACLVTSVNLLSVAVCSAHAPVVYRSVTQRRHQGRNKECLLHLIISELVKVDTVQTNNTQHEGSQRCWRGQGHGGRPDDRSGATRRCGSRCRANRRR